MAIWPFRRGGGGGSRRGDPSTDDGGLSATGTGGGAGGSAGGSPLALPLPLPASLTDFLSTAPGISWLAEELSEIHVRVPVPRPPTAREFNALVLQAYNKVLASDTGRRLAETAHAQERAAEDVLTVPLFIVEDFVRQRLRSTLGRNWGRYAFIICSRATAATALIRGLKAGARWLLRRYAPEGRARRAAEAALDLVLPTELYGAMAGIGLVALRLHKELSEIQPAPGSGGRGGGGGGGGGEPAAPPEAAAFGRGTAAGRR